MFQKLKTNFLLSLWVLLLAQLPLLASANSTQDLKQIIATELSTRFPRARIEIVELTLPSIELGDLSNEDVKNVKVFEENSKGEVRFQAGKVVGEVKFNAWLSALLPRSRIFPGEALNREKFRIQEINIASGVAREYRGVIVTQDTSLLKMESRQTLLEGQFVPSTAIQRMPDIRRGESVRVRVSSGELNVTTLGIAQEPGYQDGLIRLLTQKTKKEMVGKLLSDGSVEVKL